MAFDSLWKRVNANNEQYSPYRRLMALATEDGARMDQRSTTRRAISGKRLDLEHGWREILDAGGNPARAARRAMGFQLSARRG